MYTSVRLHRLWAGLLLLSGALMVAGCGGSSVGTISGKVSYKGQALKGGTVSVIPKSGPVQSSTIAEDGGYRLAKVPVGPAQIAVETESLRPKEQKSLPGPYAKAPKDALPPGLVMGDAKHYVKIPEQYADAEKSGLSLDVKSGKNDHNIDLK